MAKFRLGLIVNPLAGIGGTVGLKGSDGEDIVKQALAMGAKPRASARVRQALKPLMEVAGQLTIVCYPGEMGEDDAVAVGFEPVVVGSIEPGQTTAADTAQAANDLCHQGVDLILFAGGDGTARDICHVVGLTQPVLGIPAGVKIHSGVYAVNPRGAAEIVRKLIANELVALGEVEVRDIDEDAFRGGIVKARYYGELLVPQEGRYLQHVKCGGREVEELALQSIARGVIDSMVGGSLYIIGPGTTTGAVVEEMGLNNTLLGVDVVADQQLVASDATEQQLLAMVDKKHAKIVITIIGGQGHILGRGNHQLSPAVIRAVGLDNIIVISTRSKLEELEGRPLLVDTGDEGLNDSLQGYIRVVTDYEDSVMYRVEA